MPSLNKVLLIGNLTRDPELRYTGNGTPIATGGIAVNERWTDDSGQKHDKPCFIDFVAWKGTGETLAKYCSKGSTVFLEGKMTFEQWEKDDEKRSKLVLTVQNIQFLDKKIETESNGKKASR